MMVVGLRCRVTRLSRAIASEMENPDILSALVALPRELVVTRANIQDDRPDLLTDHGT